MSPVLITTLARIGLLLAAGACIGWLYGRPQLGVLVALAIALGWCMLWLFRLHRWLHGEKMPFLPQGSGIWPQIFARINFLKGRNKRRGKRFKALLKQMRQATRAFPDGGVILSDNNEIVTMNKVAEGLLGLKRKKDRGLRIENLIRDPDFVDYLRADNHSRPAEFPSPLANGRWLSSHLVPYGLEQKLLLVRDITEQRKADEMRRDFVANASHELRTPLTVITGYLDALSEDSVIAETLGGPVSEMQRQAARMRLLVDELLKLSELEAAGTLLEGKPVNIGAIIAAAGQEGRSIDNSPAEIVIRQESEADLLGDERDIQSILSNLVSNAVRYTPAEGTVTITWRTDAKGGHLTVSDTGTGIAKEHIPRLTERFYRVEDGRERIGGVGGTGLGLAIVKHALYRHGATLEISSYVGSGSEFACQFPPERIQPVA